MEELVVELSGLVENRNVTFLHTKHSALLVFNLPLLLEYAVLC